MASRMQDLEGSHAPEVAILVPDSARRAYRILHFGFSVLPIIMGLDKFAHVLTNWDNYLSPVINNILGGNGHAFMYVVGVIEIIAGFGVMARPRIFAYVVAAWLWAIILNLLILPGYFDVALRDFGLSLAALALGSLSRYFQPKRKGVTERVEEVHQE